ETLTQTYTVTLNDGNATDSIDVTITITGANDAPVIEAASHVEFMRGFDGPADAVDSAAEGYGQVVLVSSGDAGYIPTAEGGGHALISEGVTGTGPFTRFDGYRPDWTGDWTAEVKVYLDT